MVSGIIIYQAVFVLGLRSYHLHRTRITPPEISVRQSYRAPAATKEVAEEKGQPLHPNGRVIILHALPDAAAHTLLVCSGCRHREPLEIREKMRDLKEGVEQE